MTSDNDKKAAADWANRKCHLKMDGGDSYYDSEESFLEGCEHKQQQIEDLEVEVKRLKHLLDSYNIKDFNIPLEDFSDKEQEK